MKRSFINKIVEEAMAFAREQNMTLPKFAYMTADDLRMPDQASLADHYHLELG